VDRLGALRLEPELHISPQPIAILFGVLGLVLTNASEFLPRQPAGAVVGLALIAMGLIIWLVGARWLQAARWSVVAAVALLVLALQVWLAAPGTLILLALLVAAASAVVSFRAALVLASFATALLLLASVLGVLRSYATPVDVAIALFAVWGITGAAYGLYQPIHRLSEWVRDYYLRAQRAVEEVQARRAEVAQVLTELEHANRQLALANDRMAALRAVAEEVQKSKAAFVAKVSHEFRTPLNMIIGLIDLLMETPEVYGETLPPALFEDLKIVHRNCEHLSGMVNDVLDLSQAEAGRVTLRQERVDLTELVGAAVSVVSSFLERKHLALTLEIPSDLPSIYCDPTRIRQVVLNLISNAARFTERGGITVRAAQRDEWVTVSVADTGPGIAPEDAARIFEPFCQGTRGPWRDRGGSGLGLAISKQFIELHGGRIWLESQPGQGAMFAFDLPISPPLDPLAHPGRWMSEDWKWVERTSQPMLPRAPLKPRVVVCDETGELASALTRYSEQAEIIGTSSLSQAIADIRHCPAHALLLNVGLPDRLWHLAAEARSAVADTLVVACSVSPRLDRARAAGASDYLVRPVTREKLWEAIRGVGRPVRRVLLVDDDADVRQLLSRMLAIMPAENGQRTPLEIAAAADGAEALDALHRDSPDLVLLDVVLPGMDGWQVLAQKQQDAALRDIPVIMVSAQDRAEQPMVCEAIAAMLGGGLSSSQLLRCTLGLSAVLRSPP